MYVSILHAITIIVILVVLSGIVIYERRRGNYYRNLSDGLGIRVLELDRLLKTRDMLEVREP